jgi:hypothetical protein
VSDKKPSRILTFDLLRGYFLVAIILDHLAYYPNLLDWWSGRGNLFVSSAEGFFFISGIVLGIVRGAKLIDQPFQVSAKLLLKRGFQLYITAVILMLFFTLVGWFFIDNPGLKPGIRLPTEDIFSIVRGALTFEYIYGWADYLRLYAIYILASPIAIWLLRKGLWYVLLGISIFIWSQFHNSTLETLELSQIYSWQLIFFGGLTVGFYWKRIQGWWSSLALSLRKTITGSTVVISAITMFIGFMLAFGTDLFHLGGVYKQIFESLHPYFEKEALPLSRIGLFMLWFGAAFWLFWKFEAYIVRWFGWLFMAFGTNSLYVYTLQAFLVYFLHLIVPAATSSVFINLLLSVFGVVIIWVAVRTHFLMKIIPR